MIEWLDNAIVYWHWIVLGLMLITLELFAPAFVMLWLGVAAIIIGLLLTTFSLDLSTQLVIWAALSSLFIALWHRFISPRMADRTLAGLSKEAIIGQTGMVTFFNQSEGRGQLRFSAPIVGNDEWAFIFDDKLNHGDRVKVIDISGNSLIVTPL